MWNVKCKALDHKQNTEILPCLTKWNRNNKATHKTESSLNFYIWIELYHGIHLAKMFKNSKTVILQAVVATVLSG